MQTFDANTLNGINKVIKQFLESQLGEIPEQVSSHQDRNILTFYAFGVISPAEESLLHSGNKKLWIDYKVRQFEAVSMLLSADLEKMVKGTVQQVYTTITEDGIRIIHVCFN